MPLMVLQVVVGEEDLRHPETKLGKQPFVSRHQASLAHSRASLQFGQLNGPFLVTQRPHPCADCSGSDEKNFPAGMTLCSDLSDQLFHLLRIKLLAMIGQNTSAEFHHHSADIIEQLLAHVTW